MSEQTYSLIIHDDRLEVDGVTSLCYVPDDKLTDNERKVLDRWKTFCDNGNDEEYGKLKQLVSKCLKYKREGNQLLVIVTHTYYLQRNLDYIV